MLHAYAIQYIFIFEVKQLICTSYALPDLLIRITCAFEHMHSTSIESIHMLYFLCNSVDSLAYVTM